MFVCSRRIPWVTQPFPPVSSPPRLATALGCVHPPRHLPFPGSQGNACAHEPLALPLRGAPGWPRNCPGFQDDGHGSAAEGEVLVIQRPIPIKLQRTAPAGADERRRILLVGRDLGTLAGVAVVLGGDFRVGTALTVSAGLHQVTQWFPDLVILDLQRMDPEGRYFLHVLHAHLPPCPVIVLTAARNRQILREMRALPVAGVIPKPVPLNQLLARIHAVCPVGASLAPPRRHFSRHVRAAIEYLSTHHTRDLPIQGVAGAIGVSPSHLARLFRRETGMTVKQYVTGVRVEVAKRLLLDTDTKLEPVAERLGFCDAPHLSRVFRRSVGRWPGEYRRKWVST